MTMKLSFNLQDEEEKSKSFKAKIPITIFNQPFTSVVSANLKTPQDPSFSLSTNFPSGPCLKLSYSAFTNGVSPFSLSIKSGSGKSGSHHDSPLIFSAHFSASLTNAKANIIPTFYVHFKPQFGHFSIRKRTSSNHNFESMPQVTTTELNSTYRSPSNNQSGDGLVRDGWQEVKLETCGNGTGTERALELKNGQKMGFSRGVAVKARTELPLTKKMALSLRWGVNLPAYLPGKVPYLTLDKIALERTVELKETDTISTTSDGGDIEMFKGMYAWIKRDLKTLEEENREMKQSLEKLRFEISSKKSNGKRDFTKSRALPPPTTLDHGFDELRRKENGDGSNTKMAGNPVTDLESELQKAIKAASS